MERKNSRNGIYGYLSGFTAAAVLQPLENIKMVLLVPPKDIAFTSNFIKNIPIATNYLYSDGGAKAFYRGITPNVIRTGFSSSFFFSTLRFCEDTFQQYGISDSILSSFSSSLIARIVSAVVTNPLSVLQTRYEYAGHERWSGSLLKNTLKIYKNEGLLGFFKGGLVTCYKEGFFAGLYYALYQKIKSYDINPLAAGLSSGVISTFITHPFEIVRAEIQSDILTEHATTKLSIFKQIRQLYKNGEAYRGLAPRLIKKPLTNTFAFLMFEFLEKNGNKE